ncbi:MAG: hypothetical protein AAF587_04485 [Bacteroidota bacterium]
MSSNKLIRLIRTLSGQEWHRFFDFVSSPYFNKKKKLSQLATYLQQYVGDWENEALANPQISRNLFPNQPYDPQRIRDLNSFLYRLLRKFLAIEATANSVEEESLIFLQQLTRRGAKDLYQIEKKALEKRIAKIPYRDEAWLRMNLSLAECDNDHFGHQWVRTFDDSLHRKLKNLDAYYLAVKLRESCEVLNRKNILNTDAALPLMPEIRLMLSEADHAFRQIPVINVYYHIFLTLAEPEEATCYHDLLEVLEHTFQLFSPEEVRAMYKYAQNYCIRRINQGKQEWIQELFELYQRLLSNQVILYNSELAHTDFKNIVTVGLRFKAYEWVESFLETYKERIIPPHGANVYQYSLAAFYAETDRKQAAIRLLQAIKFTDIHYQISARHLLIRIYFESRDFDGLMYQINSFRHFLIRNKEMPTENRTNHLNFLKVAKKLCALADKYQFLAERVRQQRIQKILLQMQTLDIMANRSWLEEQLEQLGQK